MSQSVIENEFAPLSLSVGEIDQAGLSPIEGGGVITIGDIIECRFLYNPNSEIIDPEKSGYIRIVDSGPAS